MMPWLTLFCWPYEYSLIVRATTDNRTHGNFTALLLALGALTSRVISGPQVLSSRPTGKAPQPLAAIVIPAVGVGDRDRGMLPSLPLQLVARYGRTHSTSCRSVPTVCTVRLKETREMGGGGLHSLLRLAIFAGRGHACPTTGTSILRQGKLMRLVRVCCPCHPTCFIQGSTEPEARIW